MKHKVSLVILALLFLITLGCNRNQGIDINVIEYHKGTGGLEMEFIKNLPPSELVEGTEFVVGIELKNKGATDIKTGKITIYGFEGGYIVIDNPEIEFEIEGRKPGFPEGGFKIINFNAKNIAIPEVVDEYHAPFTVRSFYRYNTDAGAEVCINPDIYKYSETASLICNPGEVRLSGGQGAPIAITKIQETFAPFGNDIKVNFIIYFKNKGDGEVIKGVYIDEVSLAGEEITCTTDFIELKGNEEKSILCHTTTKISQGAYLTPMLVKLEYDYTSKIDKTLKIRSLNKRS